MIAIRNFIVITISNLKLYFSFWPIESFHNKQLKCDSNKQLNKRTISNFIEITITNFKVFTISNLNVIAISNLIVIKKQFKSDNNKRIKSYYNKQFKTLLFFTATRMTTAMTIAIATAIRRNPKIRNKIFFFRFFAKKIKMLIITVEAG